MVQIRIETVDDSCRLELIHLFVYGTLLCDEVVVALTGTVLSSVPAVLPHHRRLSVHKPGRDAKGPAIVYESGHHTEGRILCGIDDHCLRIFDLLELEGGGYERVTVEAVTAGNARVQVEVYRATATYQGYLSNEWSLDNFRMRHLAYYLNERIPRLVANWRAEGVYPEVVRGIKLEHAGRSSKNDPSAHRCNS